MHPASINERIEQIKNDGEELNRFIEEYKPFIASCTEKAVSRYVRFGEDDELSIALIAFTEAVKYYNSSKGNFLSFAQNVIKRRLIDYFRKERKHNNLISLNEYFRDDGEEVDLSAGESMDKYSDEEVGEYRRLELEELKKELAQWDITFSDLAEASPKHKNTRKIYGDIIRFLMTQPDLVRQLKYKKYLPIAEIEKSTGLPRKKIERARKYIIAAIIILTGDYQLIEDYINWR